MKKKHLFPLVSMCFYSANTFITSMEEHVNKIWRRSTSEREEEEEGGIYIYLLLRQKLMWGFAASGGRSRACCALFCRSSRVDSREEDLVYKSVGEKPKLWSITPSNGHITGGKSKVQLSQIHPSREIKTGG